MSTTDNLGAALWWASRGLPVGPLAGKIPTTGHGFHDFTTSPEAIRAWWEHSPGANIGARPLPGMVVVDIDPRHGGDTTWADLTAGHVLPVTMTVETGGGGLHLWFQLPRVGKVRGKLACGPGVDLKTESGYVVMPPSVHPESRRRYNLPITGPIAPLPGFLVGHVYRPEPGSVAPRRRILGTDGVVDRTPGLGLIRFVEDSPVGARNDHLFWAACEARRVGIDLEAELIAAGLAVGLPEGQIRATLASAARREPMGGVA